MIVATAGTYQQSRYILFHGRGHLISQEFPQHGFYKFHGTYQYVLESINFGESLTKNLYFIISLGNFPLKIGKQFLISSRFGIHKPNIET